MTAEAKPRTGHILPQAVSIHPDEKVLALVELNKLTTDYKELRRWQFIYVERGGEVAEWIRDMGMASDFPFASEFRIYSFWEDSAANLQDQADRMRDEDYWQKFLAERKAESTLIPEFLAFAEERWKQWQNASTFGPGFNRQRNLFARRPA